MLDTLLPNKPIANIATPPLKKIYWCHEAGTMTLAAIWSAQDTIAYIRLSEAQAAVLLLFNPVPINSNEITLTSCEETSVQSPIINFSTLKKRLNISATELSQLLLPLMHEETPIQHLFQTVSVF